MVAALDWLQQLLGGGQYGDPSTPAMPTEPLGQGQGYTADVLQHLKDVIGGKVAAGGALAQNNYDPRASFAQNALNPAGIEQATDLAFGIGPGAIRVPKARPVEPMFPQYAEVYPPVGPPTMKVGEKGNIFPEKTLTPEAEAFAKERQRIITDMNKNGYDPYFNPADRSYVDPSNYPAANFDTLTLSPKRQATIDQYMEVIGAPETRQALRGAYAKGMELGDAEHWYAMQQLEKKYLEEYGPELGRTKFLDEFAAPMAATTSGNNPQSNFLMAHYLEYLRNRGEPTPTEGHTLPYPVGGRRAGVNLRDYIGMREGGGYSGLGETQPKMHNFSRSFIGDLDRAVMDEQMAGGMLAHSPGPVATRARTAAYGLLEAPVHEEAAALGIKPGNVQDVAWAGFKGEPGKPMISMINDAIERTHRLTGMDRDEIVRRGVVRKEIPIYGLLGATGLGGYVTSDDPAWR